MGLLADVYSYGDTMKRKVRGLLDDPRATLEQFVGQLGDDTNTNIRNMQQGYGFGGKKATDPAQVAAAQKALADYGAQSGMAAATVWHGSPHKFDKFDSSKIGTGEGAQAYGHGLYLAESPDVANGYRTTLSPYELVKDGKQIPYEQMDAVAAGVASDIASKKGDVKAVRSMYESMVSQKYGGDVAKQRLAALDSMGANVGAEKGGSLYKVDLPDEHIAKMLDWDKPMVDQAEAYRQLAQQKGLPYRGNTPKGGMDIYNALVDQFGSHDAATQFLRDNGIPGIRYLDGGSRGAGQGSSNFVVFPGNENLLQILERNGQPIKGLLGQ